MGLSQHAILHRRVTKKARGQIIEDSTETTNVDHVFVEHEYSDRINRTTTGTRRESRYKIIVWKHQPLKLQDYIELDGEPGTPGTGILYEIVEEPKDFLRFGGHVSYITRRKQDQDG